MIGFLRKINRSKNYFLKSKKLSLKLNLLSALSNRKKAKKQRENPEKIKHIIMSFIGKGIGDAIVVSGAIDLLTQNGYQVSIISDKRIQFVFENQNNVHKFFLYEKNSLNQLINELRNYRDVVFVDLHDINKNSIDTFNIIRKLKPSKTIGFNNKYKAYDVSIGSGDVFEHVSKRYISFLSFLGLDVDTYEYSMSIPNESIIEAEDFLSKIKEKYIFVFNPYGSTQERIFSEKQVETLLDYFSKVVDIHVVVIGEQSKIGTLKEGGNISINYHPSFFTAAQIVKSSDLVISLDTSIVHLSRAFNKRILCIYPYKLLASGADNAVVWGPNYALARQVKLEEKNIKDVNIDVIIKHIDNEIKKLKSENIKLSIR